MFSSKKINRLLISALSGGGGKTLVSLGLSRAFFNRGFQVFPFKKGADYIDTAWLKLSAKKKAYNLDPFFLDKEQLLTHFCEKNQASEKNIALIEGNRGLYDGKDVEGSASSAELALHLDCPVILTIDCTKVTRTVAALIQGMVSFQPQVPIKGVILNRLASSRHENIIRQSIEKYCNIPVLGALPRFHTNPLPERHHGLVLEEKNNENEEMLEKLTHLCEKYTDIDALIQVASQVSSLAYKESLVTKFPPQVCIGYVKDKALWFYYEENLEALENAGAKLVPLSLFDTKSWDTIHGLYLGGGYPELYCEEIICTGILQHIKKLSDSNMPIYAECGGFMLLAQNLEKENKKYPMANIFPVSLAFHKKPQGLGYVEGITCESSGFFPNNTPIIGHEFHYSSCVHFPKNTCIQLTKGNGMGKNSDCLQRKNTIGLYTHIYAPSMPKWAKNFISLAKYYKEKV